MTSIALRSERKVTSRHWFKMPHRRSRVAEINRPLLFEAVWEFPTELLVSKPHTHQMSFCFWHFAIDETVSSVHDGEVIDKVYVARLGRNF